MFGWASWKRLLWMRMRKGKGNGKSLSLNWTMITTWIWGNESDIITIGLSEPWTTRNRNTISFFLSIPCLIKLVNQNKFTKDCRSAAAQFYEKPSSIILALQIGIKFILYQHSFISNDYFLSMRMMIYLPPPRRYWPLDKFRYLIREGLTFCCGCHPSRSPLVYM